MKETYWDQFMASGRIEDYLNYRMTADRECRCGKNRHLRGKPAERNSVNQIVLTGMVLSTMPIGEYDRRVVILTKEQGKISAFARGARRPNSPLVGAVNPLAFGEFTMYEGRTSYTIQSASITNYFAELREDVVGAYYGFYFLEVADYYAKEYTDEREMLKLLYQSMRALINPHIPNRLVRRIFELKALTVNGQAPQVFQCVICGDKERPAVFSPAKGGLVCSECSGGRHRRDAP